MISHFYSVAGRAPRLPQWHRHQCAGHRRRERENLERCKLNDEAKPTPKLLIRQHESKRVVAVVAHLRQLFRAALLDDGAVRRPIFWDHPEVLLTAASLRALLFDHSPSPILLDFLKNHGVTIQVETLETTCSMLLLSEIEPGSGPHVSDLLASILP